jgi:hypothetical protein
MTPKQRIDQAFLQLEFSVKLLVYCELGYLTKDRFDTEVAILLKEKNLIFSASSFHTTGDLVLAAQNNYAITFGFCAVALETALTDAGISNAPTDRSIKGQLRSLVYQIRNAFAHDLMTPVWRAKPAYRQTYTIRSRGTEHAVDLMALDGKPFDVEDLGGIHAFYAMKEQVCGWLDSLNRKR